MYISFGALRSRYLRSQCTGEGLDFPLNWPLPSDQLIGSKREKRRAKKQKKSATTETKLTERFEEATSLTTLVVIIHSLQNC